LDEAERLIVSQAEQLETQQQLSQQFDKQHRELAVRLSTAKEQRSALESRRAVLQEMQDKQEGISDPVKNVLARKASGEGSENGESTFHMVRGLLAELIETDVDHAELIEVALGEHQQSLIVDRL